ncbi:MAG: molybdenum cofactor biosynthesis protein B [Candidatus Hodarchaeota archaeon]
MHELPDTVKEHKEKQVEKVNFSVIVVSTSRFNEMKANAPSTDRTVAVVEEHVLKKGHSLVKKSFVPDDFDKLKNEVTSDISAPEIDVVITSGGTGISPKDCTINVLKALDSSLLPGFGELFRQLSYEEIGAASILSKSEAFLMENKCVFCLPGSPKAVKLALEKIILPEVGHVLSQLRKIE